MPFIEQRTLVRVLKKPQQKYIILLADQTVIIDNEFAAMKEAIKRRKTIVEMLPTDSRLIKQVTGLGKLLESLEKPIINEAQKNITKKESSASLFNH